MLVPQKTQRREFITFLLKCTFSYLKLLSMFNSNTFFSHWIYLALFLLPLEIPLQAVDLELLEEITNDLT